MNLYVGTLRLFIYEKDEVSAVLDMENILDAVRDLIDPEDGDRVESTQLTSFESDLEPEELMLVLARARNGLIRTRIKQCFDLAKQIDQCIHALRHRDDGSGYIPPYSHGDFMEKATEILNNNAEPV